MTNKRFIKFVLIGLFLGMAFVSGMNYWIDRYAIFNHNKIYFSEEPNQNFIKMEILLNSEIKNDSFLFGSSRVGKINPKLFQNGKYYNMTYSEGLPHEHLKNIKTLLKHNISIKNIIIALDDFSYQVEPTTHHSQPMRKLHYKSENTFIFNFYKHYLTLLPDPISILNKIKCMRQKDNCQNYDFFSTGMPIVPSSIENKIEKNVSEHIANQKFLTPTHYKGNRIEKTIGEIKNIKTICRNNNINLIILINPIHKVTYLDTNFNNFQLFKKQLSEIQNFYDFSGLNSITTNNYYWYETSHYRVKVGDKIYARIFNDKAIDVPKDFGVLVTKQNIDQHLANLRNQIKAYDLNQTQKLPN